MADRLVQQHAGPAGTRTTAISPAGARYRRQLQDRLARRFKGKVFGSFFGHKDLEPVASAAARRCPSR